jgi:hypothetical protein
MMSGPISEPIAENNCGWTSTHEQWRPKFQHIGKTSDPLHGLPLHMDMFVFGCYGNGYENK